jgi:Bacterial capsule synthesis protein PGA_cap
MKRRKSIRLGFAGDLMLGGEAVRYARARGLDLVYPFKSLLSTLAELDVLFVNLEGPLFEGTKPMEKPILLSNDPAVIEVLKLPGACVCNLANNHSFD